MTRLLTLCALAAATVTAAAQSAWLPEPKHWLITPSFTYEAFDRFMFGTTEVVAGDTVEQFTYQVSLEYSPCRDLALDLTAGYSYLPATAWALADQRRGGRTDTTVGVRWRVLDEFQSARDWMPTLTLRAGAIIEGTYPINQANVPGNGASGAAFNLLLGKRLPAFGLGAFADVGFRYRNQHVPEQWLVSGGIYKDLFAGVSAHIAGRVEWSVSGVDIGGPGFAAVGFPGTRENRVALEGGLTWLDRGSRSYSVTVARVLNGRNTPLDTAVSVALGVPF